MKTLRKEIILFTVFIWATIGSIAAQNAGEISYKAYLTNSEALWKQAIVKANDPWQKALAHYGLLSTTMATQNEDLFDDYVDSTIELLEELEEGANHKAEALALRSSVYGFIMGFSPWKGMFYGPKSSSAINEALEVNKSSGIVLMVEGSSLFYTPESFGGDKVQAEKVLEKSVKSFEAAGDTSKNWLYLNTLASLGKVYESNGKKEKAIATYQKALATEPEFTWVSKVLLPKAQK